MEGEQIAVGLKSSLLHSDADAAAASLAYDSGDDAVTPLPSSVSPPGEDPTALPEYGSGDGALSSGPSSQSPPGQREDPAAVPGQFLDIWSGERPVAPEVLDGIAAGPHSHSALLFLGTKYNSILERCSKECVPLPRYEELKKQWAHEKAERRRIYNELIELRGNIRVFCRSRPLNSDEVARGESSSVQVDPVSDADLHVLCADGRKKTFKFDRVFGPVDSQEIVFAETSPVVRSALDGYNVCIFAYGQTGTGKTFTMEGTPENRGVNFRALEELFYISRERSSSVVYDFSVSMLEVYNEKIRDLLAEGQEQSTRKLEVMQSTDGNQEVQGLVEAQVHTVDEVWDILKTGAKNRSVGSTCSNEFSSRSHSLVRVTVVSTDLVNDQRSRSYMWLVDLAGSERVGKTEVEGERLKESQFINKSLSALGDVISALAAKNAHVPYRNSKLTHLLQSSLGGDCKTIMFVNISPSSDDLGETLCSLNFATRVRGIEQGPARKQADPMESFKIKQLTEKLQQEEKEVAKLNEKLQLMNLKCASRENAIKALQDKVRDAEQACKSYQQRSKDLELQLTEEKRAARDAAAASSKPPRAPLMQRPPLARVTNNTMAARAPQKAMKLGSRIPTVHDKENTPLGTVDKTMGRARRVSLVPLPNAGKARKMSLNTTPLQQDKMAGRARRVSFTPLQEKNAGGEARKMSLITPLQQYKMVARARRVSLTPLVQQAPQLAKRMMLPPPIEQELKPQPQPQPQLQRVWEAKRRLSLATVHSIPSMSSLGDDGSSELKNSTFHGDAFRAWYRSRQMLPSAASSSPRQKLQTPSKVCFSVQRRVVLSPAGRSRRPVLLNPFAAAPSAAAAARLSFRDRRRSVL